MNLTVRRSIGAVPVRWHRAALPKRLTILSERDGRAHVLRPVGELDLATVGELEDELLRLEASDVPEICVDLSRVEFIGADGIKLLLNASTRCRERHGQFRLVRGPEVVHRAFERTGLESRLPFAD